ncbi:ROK family transcriptional regulator [Rufibacter glacialis]|uniref:ROK family transcriptional regulator n=1 Tax=Rufibacter glacialis TaxID=1259555 RepID=A0A5M8QJ72_9BACT|nr:ROK family transcriptional regulator [Rufibacter glacialis]KAA6435318.1 ROK family transcriptional regulator [Rufibacter glacialis]GGK62293.1 transcriptional regulator [Rufibacter glacialis]
MTKTFFEEINSENPTGVAFKNVNLKKKVLSYFANTGNATIAELGKELNLSVPKITSLINDLINDGLVQDHGKVDSTGGRKPNVYGLAPDSGFFLGIDVKTHHINIGLTDFQKKLISSVEKYPYKLTNNQESLEELCQIINNFISECPIPKEKILGIGINLSGRINYAKGYSYSFFHFHEDPLSKIIESHVGIKVFLENDSRAMAYGEFCSGVVNQEKDVLFLNLDYGIGMGIMINSQLYYGKSGYSGEFGHIPVFRNEIICKCGKKGCLETEAAGWALVEMFKERLNEGASTLITRENIAPENLLLEDIINAAHNDDVLAIELIAKIGEKIGKGIALLINIFNPELVILGGSLSSTEEYILLPIKSAINKYSLSLVNNDTQLKVSKLGEQAGVIGACLLVRNKLLALEHI